MAAWDEKELKAAVDAYLYMLSREQRGEPYSKAAKRRELRDGSLSNRSDQSIEYRMRNISAVLNDHGRQTLKGYLPAPNVGAAVSKQVWAILSASAAAPLEASGASVPIKVLPKNPPKMIYFNIGWMKRYAGADEDDPTMGAHGYLGKHKHGAEAFNFRLGRDGVLRGYRPPGSREQINIERLGAERTDQTIDDVAVIWFAREPGTGRTLIVGWYLNATVHRHAQDGDLDLNEERHCYSVETASGNARLLPEVARSYPVASSRTSPGAGFGQKPTWYGAESVNQKVWAYIREIEGARSTPIRPPAKPPKNMDPELRRKVERAAVEHAKAYYTALYGKSCHIESVESAAKGWDLEVFNNPDPLLVEVKGLQGTQLNCELTPNEFEKMHMRANRKRYIIYVVNSALAQLPAVPIASIFEYAGKGAWETADGRALVITERTGAVLTST